MSMSSFLCKARLCCGIRTLATASNLGIFRDPNVCSLRWLSSSSDQEHSFTVSYLIDSLGFCTKSALSASKRVTLKTCEKPDKVIELFKGYGFTHTQISTLVRACPRILMYDTGTILPKLEFFKAQGISGPEMAKMLSAFPNTLTRSLAKHIVPSYEFFRNFFHSDEKVIMAVKRCPDLLAQNVEDYVEPNIAILRECGVPDSNIAALIVGKPMVFIVSPDRFRKVVEQVEKMGFSASTITFVLAVSVFRSISKSTWESKVNAYKKCGWSDEEVSRAFERNPLCMMASTHKIMAVMDFFVKEMGLSPCRIAKRPQLLGLSLKKRLIPRALVFRALQSEGLVKEEVSLSVLFEASENKFLQKFVMPYKEKAPELMKLYKDIGE